MNVGLDFRLAPLPILGLDEVPLRAVVVDETTGLPAGISERLCRFAPAFKEHLSVMLVAKDVEVFSRPATLAFLHGCRFRLDFGPHTPGAAQQFLAHRCAHDMLGDVTSELKTP